MKLTQNFSRPCAKLRAGKTDMRAKPGKEEEEENIDSLWVPSIILVMGGTLIILLGFFGSSRLLLDILGGF